MLGKWIRRTSLMGVLVGAVLFALAAPALAATAPSLGSAQSFAVLGGSTVTNTGLTVVTGDLGVSPGTSVTGFPPGIVIGGSIHSADAVAAQAQTDLTTAYNNLVGAPCTTNLTGQDLGGLTLTPGVYCFNSTAQLTGNLTLDAQGSANAVFVFQIGSALTTAASSSVQVINGGTNCNVFWQVGSSATLGAGTAFVGNILALASITLTAGANVSGRVLARNGAVTMDTNTSGGCGAPNPSPTAKASRRGISKVVTAVNGVPASSNGHGTNALKVHHGDQVTYQITVTGQPPGGSNNGTVTDNFPQHMSFVSASPPTFVQHGSHTKGSWNNVTFSANGSKTFTITLVVNADAPCNSVLTNVGHVNGIGSDQAQVEVVCAGTVPFTPTSTPTATNTPSSSGATRTPTATKTPSSSGATSTPTATKTPSSSGATSTPTATNTPSSSGATSTPTATNTPSSSGATSTPTATNTPNSSGATSTPTGHENAKLVGCHEHAPGGCRDRSE
jgi:Ice-binding-like/Domain of unknown function DUF11